MEHKASIHFRPVLDTSEAHNTRTQILDYVHSDLSKNNESFNSISIAEMEKKIKAFCKEKSGRKLQKNAIPIREAVVNLKSNHTMKDILRLSKALKSNFGIEVFQAYIHRDEGRNNNGYISINHHAHLVCRWQDMEKGTVLRLSKEDLSKMQDLVSEVLEMERGELKTNSNRERLEAVEYKVQQEVKYLEDLRLEVKDLEQKKNTATRRNQEVREEHRRVAENANNIINQALQGLEHLQEFTEEELDITNQVINREIFKLETEIEQLQRDFESLTTNSK
jgi:FtsZ-binding cell division protein ZapB